MSEVGHVRTELTSIFFTSNLLKFANTRIFLELSDTEFLQKLKNTKRWTYFTWPAKVSLEFQNRYQTTANDLKFN